MLEAVIKGDTVREVLDYVEFNSKMLLEAVPQRRGDGGPRGSDRLRGIRPVAQILRRRPQRLHVSRAIASPLPTSRIVLVAPRNPLNIGAAARAMSNFGFARLRLVNPYTRSRFKKRARPCMLTRSSRKPKNFQTLADAIADCQLVAGTTSLGHRELQHRSVALNSPAN